VKFKFRTDNSTEAPPVRLGSFSNEKCEKDVDSLNYDSIPSKLGTQVMLKKNNFKKYEKKNWRMITNNFSITWIIWS